MGALAELLFWIVVFLVFFFGFKWLQNRKKNAVTQENDAPEAGTAGRQERSDAGKPD